jgi:malate permease and related proteins
MSALLDNLGPVVIAGVGGWLLARHHRLDAKTLSTVVIYLIAPLVNFNAVIKAPADLSMLALPLLAFVLGGCNSLLTYQWSERFLATRPDALLTASAASSANTLYFGLGLALAVLPAALIPAFLVTCIGFSLSENIFGYYFLARTHFSWRLAVQRLLKLPVLYALGAGLLCRLLGLTDLDFLTTLFTYSRGSLILLGSMILGIALGQNTGWQFQPRLIGAVLFSRHISFAALAALFLLLDAHSGQWIAPHYYALFLVFACMPIANNTLAFAATLNLPTAVVGNTIMASNLFVALLLGAGVYSGWLARLLP